MSRRNDQYTSMTTAERDAVPAYLPSDQPVETSETYAVFHRPPKQELHSVESPPGWPPSMQPDTETPPDPETSLRKFQGQGVKKQAGKQEKFDLSSEANPEVL